MRALGIALAATALLDVAMGLRGLRRLTMVAAATIAAVAASLLVGLSSQATIVLTASLLLVDLPLWAAARHGKRPPVVLAAITLTLGARVATAGLWHADATSIGDRWVHDLPFPFAAAGTNRIVYVLGALTLLATAGNTLVRLLLASTPGAIGSDDDRVPGGGRMIGSIERVLIFGLALAGEATAAAIVISAKGVLRFAEVRAAPGDSVDSVTEYVLVGSLASYALAMAFVALAA